VWLPPIGTHGTSLAAQCSLGAPLGLFDSRGAVCESVERHSCRTGGSRSEDELPRARLNRAHDSLKSR